jgi:hypothetical protein
MNAVFDTGVAEGHTKQCHEVVKRYSCLNVFPQCHVLLDTVSPYPPCRHFCMQLNHICGAEILDCTTLPRSGCSIDIPNDYFLIDTGKTDIL